MTQRVETYQQSVAIIIIVLNVLSTLSLGFVLLIYIVNWKSIASFPMRLSFYLCLACLGQSLVVIILNPITLHELETDNGSETSSFCITEGVFKVTFDLSSIIWTTIILYSVYASVVRNTKLQKIQIVYILMGFILPLVASCIPIFFNSYTYGQYFCWFDDDQTTNGFWLRMGYYFIPLWVSFIINMILALLTYKQLKKIQIPQQSLRILKRIMLFPLILFITGVFGTVSILYDYIAQYQLIWLNAVGLFFLNIYGILNSIAYGLNPMIRNRINICFTRNQHASFISQYSNLPQSRRTSRFSAQIEQQLMQMKHLSSIDKKISSKSGIQQISIK